MRAERREERRHEIERAAYAVLAEKGYAAASMLTIAKRAGASNETLYNWYGSKQGLFRSLVEANAREVAGLLRGSAASGRDPVSTLERVGPLLLRLLVSERAIALNRAAVADVAETGILGRTLAEAGRDTIVPLLAEVFEQARTRGRLAFDRGEDAVEAYLGLLVGDLQIRRAIGVCAVLGEEEIGRRAARALRFIRALFGGTTTRAARKR